MEEPVFDYVGVGEVPAKYFSDCYQWQQSQVNILW